MPSSSSITALLPRKYQEEIFTQAQQRNIIAALDTGSGKTFISTLLVKWIAAKDLDSRKIFFFVPKVPLVEQQGNFISHHSSLRVLKLHGSSNIDVSDRSGWKQKFEQHDVFVLTGSWLCIFALFSSMVRNMIGSAGFGGDNGFMERKETLLLHVSTIARYNSSIQLYKSWAHSLYILAQIFLNFMTHSLLRMEEVSLLVFDECHHARKKHPYAIIMHEYTQCSPERRPKVFGMTASPIWNPKDPTTSLKVLEDTLDAKVIGVREHAGELSEHSPKPIEMMKLYAPAPERYDYPSPSIWDTLNVFTFLKDVDLENGSQWQDIQRRYYVTLQNLGPYAASLYLFTEASNAIIRLFNIYSLTGEAEREEHAILRSSSPQKIPSELFDIADVLVDYQSFFTKPDDPSLLPVLVPLSWCTPKVRTLVDILRAHHSPTFQGIIFVEQRQIAACLAKILPQIPELIGLFKCGSFVGGVGGSERFTGDAGQEQVAQAFREHKLNLLVATSVAEEGLDFPACDVVIRFDSLDHVVGYVQSRGRARNKLSNFIVMIQEDDLAFQERYKKFIDTEPKLREAYQAQLGLFQDSTKAVNHDDDEEEEEGEILADMASRERYTVPSTRAFVTYDSALSLISHLCSLIPHDLYTPQPAPVYTGEFRSTLHLPASLPLPPKDLVYLGPVKGSKKEAKRAVAFLAVKRLHHLDVFDDYLLPIGSGRGKDFQDAEGKPVPDMSHVPPTMDVQVRDPWLISHNLYVHPISLDGKVMAGLITSSRLEPVQIDHLGSIVETQCGRLLELPSNKEMEYLRLMEDYTKLGVNIRISASPFVGHTSFFLVPLMSSGDIDFDSMEELVANPNGSSDWSSIDETHLDHLLVYNVNQHGRTWLLRGLRPDLTPMSLISTDDSPQTYYDYYLKRWSPKAGKNRNGWAPVIPTTGPMVELSRLIRSKSTQILTTSIEEPNVELSENFIIPQGCCNWLSMSVEVSRIFHILPTLTRRITDIYRARAAKFRLSLPPINDDLMVQALTIPSTLAPYNNQRLETLGDAVLEVCTTVHLMNKFPHRHEGQLSIIRQQSICNRFLMYRALEVNLDAFITSEPMTVRSWKSHIEVKDHESGPLYVASRSYPRRSLQDCMEATLGAAFLTGGIPMALQAGNALGLTFGGPSHWSLRYSRVENTMIPPMYTRLQDQLGYDFNNVYLLREALTHPSFASEAEIIPSYQRLEFLGDALLDLVVIHYLYNKFPQAESAQLALPRTKAVCSQALAFLAVKKLELHQVILLNNVGLSKAIDGYVPHLQGTSAQAIVNTGWKLDPPKVLSDVFESVIGAVLIDSGYDYERTACVVEFAMQEILNLLSPSIPLDPISALVHWIAASVCRAPIEFIVVKQGECEGTQVVLHGTVIAGPVISASLLVSKNLVAERALAILQDTRHERCLSRLCVCDAEKDLGMASGTYVVELDNVNSSLEDG